MEAHFYTHFQVSHTTNHGLHELNPPLNFSLVYANLIGL